MQWLDLSDHPKLCDLDWLRGLQYCSGLTSIDIPNSVTTIGKLAFSHTGLTELTIPHSLTSIGGASFANCDNLRTVHWNAKTCSIYNYSSYSESYYEDYGKMGSPIGSSKSEYSPSPFSIEYYVEIYYENIGQNESYEVVDSDGITDFIFGDEVETISSSLCKWLDDLSYVVIPNSVTSIGDSAFFKCTGLTSVTLNSNTIVSKTYSSSSNISSIFGTQVRNYIIGGNVNAIGYYAFYGCTGLTSVTIGNSVTEIRRSAFYECSDLTSVTIPNSVTHIGEGAFAKCTGLTSVTIPNSVIEIRSYAFQDCSDLTSIYSKIKNPQAVTYGGSRIFYNVPKSTCALYIPKGKYDIYSTTIPWSEFSNIIEMDPTGDVNDDGSVNVTDYVTTASYILEKDPQPFYFEEGDLDENGLITINDLVAVAYQALHFEDNAPSILHNAQCIIKNEECSMGAVVQGNEVIINLSNEIDLTALQMDLALPTGMTLVDASLSGRASASHQVAFNQLSNGDYRLLASSPACKAFNGNDGTVLTLTLAGEPIKLTSKRADETSVMLLYYHCLVCLFLVCLLAKLPCEREHFI